MQAKIYLSGFGDETMIARKVVDAARSSNFISKADLLSAEKLVVQGGVEEKGTLMDVAGIVVTLLNGGGAEALFNILKPFWGFGQPATRGKRRIIFEIPPDVRLELDGDMSDDDFLETRNRLINILLSRGGNVA